MFFKLNKDKTEVTVFGTNEEELKICAQLNSLSLQSRN